MKNISTGAKKNLLLAALAGAALSFGVNYLVMDDSAQSQKLKTLESTIKQLESSLALSSEELRRVRMLALRESGLTNANTVAEICKQVKGNQNTFSDSDRAPVEALPSSVLALKNLETDSESDRRSIPVKLNEFLSGNPTKEKIAIASRAVFDKAHDPDGMPDFALQSLYGSQSDPDLKRVIAQVMSQRGNNTMLDNQIAEAQAHLRSGQPRDRQEALNQLAKMHTIKAVDAIAPYLQDPDTNVKLEALFALRDSGNQKHVGLVEMMANDPDPSVSSLANDVISNLSNLSSSARTRYSNSDIQAELPPMANP